MNVDKELNEIVDLKWLPWIGEQYEKSEKRLLLIGKSHWSGFGEEKTFTRDVVKGFMKDPIHYPKEGGRKFFLGASEYFTTALQEAISDEEKNKKIQTVWHSLAFMQFFQGDEKDKTISWAVHVTACQAVYRIIQATHAIVLCKPCYNVLGNEHKNEKGIDERNRLYVPHPSRSPNPSAWPHDGGIEKIRNVIKKFLS